MTREEVRRKLYSYTVLKAEAAQILEEIARLRAAIESPKGQKLTGMPGGGGSGDPLLLPVERILSLEARYKKTLEGIYSEQAEIEDMIETLPPKLRMLIRFRYIAGHRWEEVCIEIGYEWRQTHRMHRKAIDMIAENMA